ncbi:helix-turn-helix transcriptional regulator [Lactococcus piscium]|uniref:winged helix-turn-helix transcriptional regulator n=1 Tax=Pseudolactococcus carnosus TaxID=2749961 RepID=UPI001FBBD48C|nr:helix-turn-helix domain-containing protein [Lactococcus carnosus]MCJ1995754.1 helix-turn-helix transcriptional regulator [Lactococcus carnosus]
MVENECGISKIMAILGGKWQLNILWQMSKQPDIRFNQLKREVRGITIVMLTRCLVTLVAYDLVSRTDFNTIPPHVVYRLTDKGRELVPFLNELNNWGKQNF